MHAKIHIDNIRRWLEEAETKFGEPIKAIVVGPHNDHSCRDDTPRPDENVILDREVGLAKLDLEYDSGYGGANCYPMYAWTESWVFLIHEYDGATSLRHVPRHPLDIEPRFGGQ